MRYEVQEILLEKYKCVEQIQTFFKKIGHLKKGTVKKWNISYNSMKKGGLYIIVKRNKRGRLKESKIKGSDTKNEKKFLC